MEFRKMVTITLYTRQQKRHWCIEQAYGLCGRGRGWEDLGEWHWNMWNVMYEKKKKETDCQCRGCGFDPWSREMAQTGQLSLPASTVEPMHPRVHILQENPSQREAWVPQLQGSPCSPELKKACAEQQRAHAAKRRPSTTTTTKKTRLLPGPCTECDVNLLLCSQA